MDDMTSRLEAMAQSLRGRFAKILHRIGDAADAVLAPGTGAGAAKPAGLKSKAQAAPSNLALLLFAAFAISAVAALITDLSYAFLNGPGASAAKLSESVAALDKRVEQAEREERALGSRVAAAENAITKTAASANAAIAEIRKVLGALPAGESPPDGGASGLAHLERRVAALEKAVAPAALPAEAGAETGEAGAHGGHGEASFPPFDAANFGPMLIWLALTFGTLYLLMAKVALPRVEDILKSRAHKIASDIAEAHRLRQKSEEAAAAREKLMAEARAKALALAQETHAKLSAETEAKRAALEAELNAKLAASEAQIHDMKARAMGGIDAIAKDTAAAIVQRITGKPADESAVANAVAAAKA